MNKQKQLNKEHYKLTRTKQKKVASSKEAETPTTTNHHHPTCKETKQATTSS